MALHYVLEGYSRYALKTSRLTVTDRLTDDKP